MSWSEDVQFVSYRSIEYIMTATSIYFHSKFIPCNISFVQVHWKSYSFYLVISILFRVMFLFYLCISMIWPISDNVDENSWIWVISLTPSPTKNTSYSMFCSDSKSGRQGSYLSFTGTPFPIYYGGQSVISLLGQVTEVYTC